MLYPQNLKLYPPLNSRHVQKSHFVKNLLRWLTFICILFPRTIFDLSFLIKFSFQGCPEPLYYTKENTKKKEENHIFAFFNFWNRNALQNNLKQLAVFLRSLWFHGHPYWHILCFRVLYSLFYIMLKCVICHHFRVLYSLFATKVSLRQYCCDQSSG